MSQVRADNLVSPYERPAVGMELGGSYVELGQELPFKACEGKSEFDLLEHRRIDEVEGVAVITLVISADRLTRGQGCTDTLSSCSLLKER